MKYRVIGLENGEEIVPESYEAFCLMEDGTLSKLSRLGDDCELFVFGGYVLEFSFSRDDQGEDVWSHSVVYD